MMRHGMVRTAFVVAMVATAGCSVERNEVEMGLAEGVDTADLAARVADFAPADIEFDETALADWEKAVLAKLVEASDIMHELFARQVARENPEWAEQVARRGEDDAATAYYEIMVGPWDRQADHAPFLDVGGKPAGAGYYPADLTRQELEGWIEGHPEDREAFASPFTLIEREGDSLVAIPYSEAFGPELERAAELLQQAAELSENASLSEYLRSRAQ
ncbi:MAG: peptidase, partial [Gemmatimonadetes bacterium]|nr:peptidase [Gemmatimonadota bacterium]